MKKRKENLEGTVKLLTTVSSAGPTENFKQTRGIAISVVKEDGFASKAFPIYSNEVSNFAIAYGAEDVRTLPSAMAGKEIYAVYDRSTGELVDLMPAYQK